MKKIVSILLLGSILCGSVLATACGGGRSNSSVIKVWFEADGAQAQVLNSFVDYFNSNNDLGYTMEYEIKSSVTKDIGSANQSRTAPDLIMWPRWETITQSRHIMDLSAKIASSSVINLNDYNSKARSEVELGGKVYGIPVDLNAWGIWANMDLVGDASLPTTWDELIAITQQLTSGTGASKIAGLDAYNLRGQFYTFMLTANGQLVDNSGSLPTVNINVNDKNSQSYKDAASVIELFKTLMNATGVPTDYHTNEYFIANKVALKFGPSHFAKTLEILTGEQMNLKFIGYPAKSTTEGKNSGMLGGFSLGVPTTANLNKSFDVIEWWLSDENLAKYCELYEILPAKESLHQSEFISQNATLTTMKELLSGYDVRPVVKGYSNVESAVIFDAIDRLRLNAFSTTDDCLKHIKTEGDKYFELESLM